MNKWSNVIRGVAYGDAWGDRNEFKSYAMLTANGAFSGPPLPENLRITDDTQMTLALARALNGTPRFGEHELRGRVLSEWVRWYRDPDNNRAPGRRCMAACAVLSRGLDWQDAVDDKGTNDGCGSVMRNAPVAFLPEKLWQPVAAWQAVTTHGGANGIAACLVDAAVIRFAAMGYAKPGHLTELAVKIAEGDITGFDFDYKTIGRWLGWHPLVMSDDWHVAADLLEEGLNGLLVPLRTAASRVREFQRDPWADDPCNWGGEGWRAHHALATALLSADTFPDDPVMALRRATVTGGDSDSIAAVAGGILGAAHADPWPREWFARLEPRYQRWIADSDYYEFS